MIAIPTSPVRRRGTTVVETAVVSIVCFIFMFGLFEYGRIVQMRNMLENAARTGARTAVVEPVNIVTTAQATSDVDNAVLAVLAGSNLQNIRITIFQADTNGNMTTPNWTAAPFGQNLVVMVEADYPNLFPTFGWLPQSGTTANSTYLKAVSMMRSEAN